VREEAEPGPRQGQPIGRQLRQGVNRADRGRYYASTLGIFFFFCCFSWSSRRVATSHYLLSGVSPRSASIYAAYSRSTRDLHGGQMLEALDRRHRRSIRLRARAVSRDRGANGGLVSRSGAPIRRYTRDAFVMGVFLVADRHRVFHLSMGYSPQEDNTLSRTSCRPMVAPVAALVAGLLGKHSSNASVFVPSLWWGGAR